MTMETVVALYEKGRLRPLTPLNLRENQRVRIQIVPDEESVEDEGEAAVRALVSAGLMQPPQRKTPPPDPLSAEERRALADRLGRIPGQSLSEIVSEDRGPL
jgi:predicted DNA-binding antitoxin AbrB/MazE fold protein